MRDTDSCDFKLVPLPLIEGLYGHKFDLVANTASLGEMTDASAHRYMRFIQDDLDVRFFYSNNRYGQLRRNARFTGCRMASTDAAKCPVRLDPFWRILEWNLYPDNFILFEPNAPPSLELLAERVPSWTLPEVYRSALSHRLLDEANKLAHENSRWQFLIWESIRLRRTPENLLAYLDFLARNGFEEFHSYSREFFELTGKSVELRRVGT
ncbi:MAG: hypothetical protein EBS90_13325 [Betaproteobacteria bacterium]|nr:hypothetical protein [Betaproteobacteria bacterium]